MAFNTNIIPAATGAQATPQPYDATAQQQVFIAANNLATTETCSILINVTGSTYVPLGIAGAAATLTATVPSVILPGGVTYGITKQATAGACGVWGTPVLNK